MRMNFINDTCVLCETFTLKYAAFKYFNNN